MVNLQALCPALRMGVHVNGDEQIGLLFVRKLGPILQLYKYIAIARHDDLCAQLFGQQVAKQETYLQGDVFLGSPATSDGARVFSTVARIDDNGLDLSLHRTPRRNWRAADDWRRWFSGRRRTNLFRGNFVIDIDDEAGRMIERQQFIIADGVQVQGDGN